MTVIYKCVTEPLPNIFHHNVLIDDAKARYIESSTVPASPDDVISGIKDGILTTTPGWVTDCP